MVVRENKNEVMKKKGKISFGDRDGVVNYSYKMDIIS